MLARDAADKLGWKKPVALHTPLLPGLKGGNRMDPIESKMSKSKPEGNITIHDDRETIAKKMKKAYCPMDKLDAEGNEEINPVLMLCKYIIIPRNGCLFVDRPEQYGGPVTYNSYEELEEAYFDKKLSPFDLKTGVTDGMAKTLAPVAEYFEAHPENRAALQKVLEGLTKLR